MADWKQVSGGIERHDRSSSQEVDFDESGLTVRLEAGNGYMRQSLDTFVPMSVVVEMFRVAGYSVSPLASDATKTGGAQ